MQPVRQFARQAVDETSRKKKNTKMPVKIAPVRLVAAKVTPKSTRENKIVPKAPMRFADKGEQTQGFSPIAPANAEDSRLTARYTTAMPKSTHKKTGVTVMAAVKRRKVAMTPRTIEPMTDKLTQFQLQEQGYIKSPPMFSICGVIGGGDGSGF